MPDQRIDPINTQIAVAMADYEKLLEGLPEPSERSVDQEKNRIAKWENLQALKQKKEMVERAIADETAFDGMRSEMSKNRGESGAVTRDAVRPYGETEVADKQIYPNPETGIGEQCRDIAIQARGTRDYARSAVDAANRRLERANNRRIHLMSRAYDPATQMEKIPSLGGIFLETERSYEAIELGYNNSLLASRCLRRRMSAMTGLQEIYGLQNDLSRKDGARNGNVKWTPIDELEEIMRSQVRFENKLTIKPTKMGAGYNASREIVNDVPFLTGEINGKFMNELPFAIQSYIWEGIGGKEPMVGVKNCNAKYIQPKKSGQAAKTFLWENLIEMWKHMHGGGYGSAIWVKTKWLEDQLLALQIPVGSDAELVRAYVPAASPESNAVLYGNPCFTIEQADIPGQIGDIAFLDMSKYLITDKGSMYSASSVEVQFWADQWAFKFIIEIDGQSLLTDKITPYKAPPNEYESPFVFLDVRV